MVKKLKQRNGIYYARIRFNPADRMTEISLKTRDKEIAQKRMTYPGFHENMLIYALSEHFHPYLLCWRPALSPIEVVEIMRANMMMVFLGPGTEASLSALPQRRGRICL